MRSGRSCCYNNTNRLTASHGLGRAEGRALGGVEGNNQPIRGFINAQGGGAWSLCCSLTPVRTRLAETRDRDRDKTGTGREEKGKPNRPTGGKWIKKLSDHWQIQRSWPFVFSSYLHLSVCVCAVFVVASQFRHFLELWSHKHSFTISINIHLMPLKSSEPFLHCYHIYHVPILAEKHQLFLNSNISHSVVA